MAGHQREYLWHGPFPSSPSLAIVRLINLGGSPQRVDDEGTYVAQAYAVSRLGELSHYTYWYDHPPLGWIQIALWEKVTLGFSRYNVAVLAGREFIVVGAMSWPQRMLFILGEAPPPLPSGSGSCSPDTRAVAPSGAVPKNGLPRQRGHPVVACVAFVLALAPSRQLAAFAGAAICFSIAVLEQGNRPPVPPVPRLADVADG